MSQRPQSGDPEPHLHRTRLPLYLFVKDKDSGDACGQGAKAFGADWYDLALSGSKVDKS